MRIKLMQFLVSNVLSQALISDCSIRKLFQLLIIKTYLRRDSDLSLLSSAHLIRFRFLYFLSGFSVHAAGMDPPAASGRQIE